MVTVTVLPVRSRSTVPKVPVSNPELELPCVRLTMQLVVETHTSADAGLAGRMPARLPAATMLTNPSRNRLKLSGIVERTIGWIGNFRRLTVRYDRLLATYGGFFHLARALLVLRRVLK